MCIIPYGTQLGEISFCAYNTGVGWRHIVEKMYQNASTAEWYAKNGKHAVYANPRKAVPLAPLGQPVSLSIPKDGVLVPVEFGKGRAANRGPAPDGTTGHGELAAWTNRRSLHGRSGSIFTRPHDQRRSLRSRVGSAVAALAGGNAPRLPCRRLSVRTPARKAIGYRPTSSGEATPRSSAGKSPRQVSRDKHTSRSTDRWRAGCYARRWSRAAANCRLAPITCASRKPSSRFAWVERCGPRAEPYDRGRGVGRGRHAASRHRGTGLALRGLHQRRRRATDRRQRLRAPLRARSGHVGVLAGHRPRRASRHGRRRQHSCRRCQQRCRQGCRQDHTRGDRRQRAWRSARGPHLAGQRALRIGHFVDGGPGRHDRHVRRAVADRAGRHGDRDFGELGEVLVRVV